MWWIVAGMVISMLASITGALTGAGPSMIIAAVRVRAPAVATDIPERETTVAQR